MVLALNGNYKQETTRGKQLFNKDNLNFLATGSNVKHVSIEKGFKIVCIKNNTTYSGSFIKIRLGSINDFVGKLRIKTTAIISDNGNFRAGLVLYYGNASNYSESGKIAERDGNYGGTTIFDIESDITEQSDFTHLYLVVYGNSSGSAEHYMNDGDYTTYDNFIITLNNEDMTYEKYTGGIPAPNPNYKQDIEVIDGCNRFDETEILKAEGWTKNNDGYYNGSFLKWSNTFDTKTSGFTIKGGFRVNTQYILVFKGYVSGGTASFRIKYDDETFSNYLFSNTSEELHTIISTAGKNVVGLYGTYTSGGSNTLYVKDVQLTEGTEEKTYLPHGCVGLKFSGKQLLYNTAIPRTKLGVTVSYIESEDVYLINGTAEANGDIDFININESLDTINENESFSAGIKQVGGTLTGKIRLAVAVQYADNTFSWAPNPTIDSQNQNEHIERTKVEKSGKIVRPRMYVFKDAIYNNLKVKLSIMKGSTITYEPYHKPQLIPINLAGNSIAKVNDSIKDELEIYRNVKVILEKKIGKQIINSEEIETAGHDEYENIVYYLIPKKNDYKYYNKYELDTNILCSVANTKNINWSNFDDANQIGKINAGSNDKNFWIGFEKGTTLEQAKEILNNQVIYYELLTPQTIELPSINMPQLWEGTVNVELISNLATNLNINYNIVPAMPSLEAKAEINSIDDVNIRICNENLAYEGWAEDFVSRINNSGRATIVTKDGRKCLLYSPDAGYNDYDNKYLFKTNWKENVQYTFKFDAYLLNKNGYANLCLQYTDGTEQELSNLKTNEWNKVNFKSKASKTIKYLRVNWRSESTYIDLDTFMVYEGTEISQFIPNQTNKLQMVLGKSLRGLKTTDSTKANYIDENGAFWITDYIDDLGIHRKIGEISFDGTENSWSDQWSQSDTDTRKFFSLQINSIKNDTKNRQAICNFFKYTNSNIQSKTVDITAFHFNNGANFSDFIYFKIEKFLLPTPDLAGWKALLAQLKEKGKPLTIQYELGEEKLEEFTEEERKSWNEFKKMKTFKSKNYINSTDEIQAGLEFSYKKDNRISTKKELEKCNERLANIEQLLSTTETSSLLLDNLEKDLEEEV